uniref:Uncharacterized protein n=1 Tax=Loxodonta africana TaxID=9785 RepID=G3UAG5_LOXAF
CLLDCRFLAGSRCGLRPQPGAPHPKEAGGLVPDLEWSQSDCEGRVQQAFLGVGTASFPREAAPGVAGELQVLDTDYKRYAILRVSLHWRGSNFEVLKYFKSHTQGLSP